MKNNHFLILCILFALLCNCLLFGQIQILPDFFDHKIINQGVLLYSSFIIENKGKPITLNIKLSCDCISINERQISIKKNEKYKLSYQYDTSEYSGEVYNEIIFTDVNNQIDPFYYTFRAEIKTNEINPINTKFDNVIQTEKFDLSQLKETNFNAIFSYPDCKKCITLNESYIKWLKTNHPDQIINFYSLIKPLNKTHLNELVKYYKRSFDLPIFIHNKQLYNGKNAYKNLIAQKTTNMIPNKNQNPISLIAIILSGLLDGINPCAFTVIILLLAYLSSRFNERKDIILAGFFYIFAVFITYFLVGIGIFEFVRQLNAFKIFSAIFKHALTIALLCLALFSLYDFIQSLKGKTEKMILKLPNFLQQSIRKNIRIKMSDYKILLGSLILGFTVSILELVCTGQVYFPIIGYMVRNSGEQTKGIILLLFYNTAFIIPLGVIFLLVFFGISSKKIGDLFSKYLAVVKFLFFLLFVSFTIINLIL